MKTLHLLFCYLLFSCFSCSENANKLLLADCATIEDSTILKEREKAEACHYLQVYQYQLEIYTVCECCDCDKAPMAINCNGLQLCEWTENCMIDFYNEAQYLFSVEMP